MPAVFNQIARLRAREKAAFWRVSDRGATAIEYGLIVAAVALAISAFVFTMGDGIKSFFNSILSYF